MQYVQMIGESRIADAILDRIVHNSHEILIEGNLSMRERMEFEIRGLAVAHKAPDGAEFIACYFPRRVVS